MKLRKSICVFALMFFIACGFLLAACTEGDNKIHSYRDIPGATGEEIAAFETLLAEKDTLVYGSCVTNEAFVASDGSVGGFTKLLAGRITDIFGFKFTLKFYNWGDLVAGLHDYSVDISTDFTLTEERKQEYIMTDAIVQRTVKIFTNSNNEPLSIIAESRPINCAFLYGGSTYETVKDKWALPFNYVPVQDQSLIPQMMLDGDIDAFIEEGAIEEAFDSSDFVLSNDFYPLQYSPTAITTCNDKLVPFITLMQKYLASGGAYELTELYREGYHNYLVNKLQRRLTPDEKSYIRLQQDKGVPIPVLCETDNYPSNFYNEREKKFQGLSIDIIEQVGNITGLTFKAGNAPGDDWKMLLAGLERGDYSIAADLMKTSGREGRFLWADKPSFEDNTAFLSRIDYPNSDVNRVLFAKIGLIDESAYAEIFYEWFPDIPASNIVVYNSASSAFDGLERGDIDLMMASQNLLLYQINYREKTNFKVNLSFDYSTNSYIGFNKNKTELQSIFSKAMNCIDTRAIASGWQQKVFDYNRKLMSDIAPYVIGFVALLLGILAIVAVLFLKNRRMSKNLANLVDERTEELALQTSTLGTIFEAIPDMIFCKDTDLNFTRCNRSFETHFQKEENEIIGKNDVTGLGLPQEVADLFKDVDLKIINEKFSIAREEVIPAADGRLPVFETIKTPLLQDGQAIGLMGISRDITARKTAENALKLTLDNLDTCIYVTDTETDEILFINDKMRNEFGIDSMRGKKCWEVLQSGQTERCPFCPVPKLIENGGEYYVWEEHNSVTGKDYRNTDSIIKWHDGRNVHMQHSVDVTKMMALQKELTQASKAKGDFLSRMSHEMRTPLNAIIGMNSIAMGTDDIEKIQHCQDKIDNASRHLLGIINDILDMSKIEANKFELSPTEFAFEKMLMNITNVVNFKSDEKKQNLVLSLANNLPDYLICDDIRLGQVITNLLTNAVKFTPENGTIVLSICKESDDGENIVLKFAVQDNGIGIPFEQQPKLFSSFEQADGTISRKFGGTGLGLAISKRIVELMGGAITLHSVPGEGSTFEFTVRAQKGKGSVPASLLPAICKDNIRVMAVDDCEQTREYFKCFMDANKLPCDVAESGTEALGMIASERTRPYNVFFVDWQMPGMDGIELTKRIKELTGENSIVIMISVTEWNAIEEEAIAAGVKQFVSKPLFPSTIINAINCCFVSDAHVKDESSRTAAAELRNTHFDHKILVAEDNEINREILATVLEETGLVIDFAEDGKQAVNAVIANPDKYDLIFMDINMPEMDGYEATRSIRALGFARTAQVPIIAMTANVFREDVENCLAAGMNDHIGKPIDQTVLFQKLHDYLK